MDEVGESGEGRREDPRVFVVRTAGYLTYELLSSIHGGDEGGRATSSMRLMLIPPRLVGSDACTQLSFRRSTLQILEMAGWIVF